MCLIVFSFEHPSYKLIVGANRDEFYARRTAPASFWTDYPFILGGRDLEAMGTWMGVTRNGKIAMVTNYRDLKNLKPDAPSRGRLILDYLTGQAEAEPYLAAMQSEAARYNGFNLLIGDPGTLWYFSNYAKGISRVDRGTHGLSNHLLDTGWPKVKRAREKFEQLLSQPRVDHKPLLDMLYDERQAPDKDLPDTGVGIERERMLSPIFIKSTNYGSRCSTVITVSRDNLLTFTERVYEPPAYTFATRSFEFQINEPGQLS